MTITVLRDDQSARSPAHWGKFSRFYSIHYQDEFRVEMGVKISEIYHRIDTFWFGARPFSLGGARMENL